MKPIRLSQHARGYIQRRGFTMAEVEQAIRESRWNPAELNRLQCRKNFSFNSEWNGKHYATKEVRPVFAEHPDEIAVITVYTYYF